MKRVIITIVTLLLAIVSCKENKVIIEPIVKTQFVVYNGLESQVTINAYIDEASFIKTIEPGFEYSYTETLEDGIIDDGAFPFFKSDSLEIMIPGQESLKLYTTTFAPSDNLNYCKLSSQRKVKKNTQEVRLSIDEHLLSTARE